MRKLDSYYRRVSKVVLISILFFILTPFPLKASPVQAGNGTAVNIPLSSIVPSMDGICSPSEYSDATMVTVTLDATHTFPVYMKHTADDAYFCFGDSTGLPLPAGGTSSVTVYIDRSNDGPTAGNNGDDFGIWMPYDSTGLPFANYWGTTNYTGADPGGWQAVKHQITGGSPLWQVEFRISRLTMGGWNHPVGLALFYAWWRFPSDDYSWPANGIWAAPQLWGKATLSNASVNIGLSSTVPVVDGACGAEYADASTVTFNTSSGLVTGYLKHSATDLYVCLTNLTIPALSQQNSPNAVLYLNRNGTVGAAPDANDFAFTISYNGTVQVNSGDGVGFTGPDPGGNAVARALVTGSWDAEFRVSSATIGTWLPRSIGLALVEQNLNSPGDDYGWPTGYSKTVPNTWGQGNLLQLGSSLYLPEVAR